VRNPPLILIADDNEANLDILVMRLQSQGYAIATAKDGEEALAQAREVKPDLVLLDIMMPKIDGVEVCRRLKGDKTLPFMPIILVTAKADTKDVVAGLEAGGDEYLTKPVDQASLMARVRSILRTKSLHDQVEELNRDLEERVAKQIAEIERIGELRRFLSPQVADLVSNGAAGMLESHRREITVVFCDMRGFTAFAETSEPEEVMGVMREYHAALGALIHEYEGTLERFVGDGLMVLFNDPVPCPDPAARAVRMAIAMRDRIGDLSKKWSTRGHELGFGIGIAQGYATLGRIGFEGRFDYGSIGTVSNLGARLCNEAVPGQILVSRPVQAAVDAIAECAPIGELTLKGLSRPVAAFNVVRLKA
jgi:class 3 adenylate cyclase/CheY-like chemotaxis protein